MSDRMPSAATFFYMFANLAFGVEQSSADFDKNTTAFTSSVHLDLNLFEFLTFAICWKMDLFLFSVLIVVLITHTPSLFTISVKLFMKL